MNNVRTRTVACCYRRRVGTDVSVLWVGVSICFCFHMVADVSMVSMAN